MNFRYFSLIVATSALAMVSCSDDDPNEGNNPDNPNVPSEGVQSLGNVPVNVYTDLSKFGGSIYNYNPMTRGSRAGENLKIFEFTEEYSAPENLEEITPGDYSSTQNGIIKQSGTYNFTNGDGAKVYVEATGVVINDYGKNGTYYVKSGASVDFEPGLISNTKVVAWGTIKTPSIDNSHIEIKGDFNGKDGSFTMNNDCSLNVDGNVTFSNLSHYKGNISASTLTINGDLELTNDIELSVTEFIKVTGDFTFRTQGKLCTKCLDVVGDLNIDNNGYLKIRETLHASNIYNNAGGAITLASGTTINVDNQIDFSNTNCCFDADDNKATSYVKASSFRGNMDYGNEARSIIPFFKGNITVDEDIEFINSNRSDETVLKEGVEGSYVFERGTVTFSKIKLRDDENGCSAGSATKPTPVPPVTPEVIGGITQNHTHPISATCVALGPDNDFYLSWHKRGAGQADTKHAIWGCIERLAYDPSNNKVELVSFMETDNAGSVTQHPVTYESVDGAYDFNHVIYHNGKLYATGEHPKKGGFIAEINLPMGEWENSLDIMTARSLLSTKEDGKKGNGISGNCVVATPEGKFLIADAGGYQEATRNIFDRKQRFDDKGKPVTVGGGNPVYDWVESLAIDKEDANPFKLTNGSAKHIAINGNMVATIEYTRRHTNEYDEDDVNTTLPALISVYDQYSNWLGTPAWTASVEEFAPIYGKNVIAVDNDGTVYSCQGRNGVAKYTAGGETGRFTVTEWAEDYTDENGATFNGGDKKEFAAAAANGLCIYGDYLLVAYGGAGVYVLDKNTLDVKSWYDTGGSANYVQVDKNGIAIIAYGITGAQVVNFKFSEL